MNGREKSDSAEVAVKPANKTGMPAAEPYRAVQLPTPRPWAVWRARSQLLSAPGESSTRPIDQSGGEPFLIVQKHFQHVLGRNC
jgi:hypothetical protein